MEVTRSRIVNAAFNPVRTRSPYNILKAFQIFLYTTQALKWPHLLCGVSQTSETQHRYAPREGVGDCQKMKMYLSDPDIAMWQPVHPPGESLTPWGKTVSHTQTLSKEESWGKGEEGGGSTRGRGSVFLSQTHLPSSRARERVTHSSFSVAQSATHRYTGYNRTSDREQPLVAQLHSSFSKEGTDSLPYVWLLSGLHSKCATSFSKS